MQKIFDGVDSEALLAIPFFLLVGELMSSANVVVRIANLSLSLVGHIRGGLSQVVVVFSHVLLGNVGIDHRRRRRDEPRAGRPDEAGRLQPRLHRRDHRRRLHHRGAGAAEHHRRGLWRGRQRLDRRPVHGRRRARTDDRLRPDDLLLFLRALRHAQAARAVAPDRVRGRRCRAAADDPGDPARRHPDRLLHADGSRRRRRDLDHRGGDPRAQPRAPQEHSL